MPDCTRSKISSIKDSFFSKVVFFLQDYSSTEMHLLLYRRPETLICAGWMFCQLSDILSHSPDNDRDHAAAILIIQEEERAFIMTHITLTFETLFELGTLLMCIIGNIIWFIYSIFDTLRCKRKRFKCPRNFLYCLCFCPDKHDMTPEEANALREELINSDEIEFP